MGGADAGFGLEGDGAVGVPVAEAAGTTADVGTEILVQKSGRAELAPLLNVDHFVREEPDVVLVPAPEEDEPADGHRHNARSQDRHRDESHALGVDWPNVGELGTCLRRQTPEPGTAHRTQPTTKLIKRPGTKTTFRTVAPSS